jgi:vacuolar protein sorting-associated protein 35
MNRLWIRMQHSGAKDKARRESDRHELNLVVGENLVRLSSLEGVDLATYKSSVLPKLLDIIQSCKDAVSQQYLMDCIIQVFTDEYHLQTLEKILDACTTLNPNVDVKTIIIALMDRLSRYAKVQRNEIEAVDKQINIFGLFKKSINKLLEEQGVTGELKKLIELQVAFLRFSIETYPDRVDYVNAILELCVKILQLQPGKSITEDCLKSVVKLLVIPLDVLAHSIFGLSHYPALMQYLSPPLLKTVAKKIVLVLQSWTSYHRPPWQPISRSKASTSSKGSSPSSSPWSKASPAKTRPKTTLMSLRRTKRTRDGWCI